MSSKKDTTAVEVTWTDQRYICTFGRMNRRYAALETEIKQKQQDLENLDDAADEVMIADDIMYVYGESFVTVDADAAGDLVSNQVEKINAELAALKTEQSDLNEGMKDLKAKLYAKFGSQIYLENE